MHIDMITIVSGLQGKMSSHVGDQDRNGTLQSRLTHCINCLLLRTPGFCRTAVFVYDVL